MRAKSKILATALAAALLVTGTVFGTMAYLTDRDTVTNTMTVGNIDIALDEARTEADGTKVTPEERVQKNTYKLVPGHEYTKDPTVHVTADSEDSYVFVKVTNEIADIEAAETTDYAPIAKQIEKKGWKELTGYKGVYYQEYTSQETVKNLAVFANFKIDGDVDNAKLAEYAGKTIVVNAYAVQQDGFDSAEAAWAATFGAEDEDTQGE